MVYDRQISITVGASRDSKNWTPRTVSIEQFYTRLGQVKRGDETLAEYLALTKPEQDELKDVGGYVAGTLKGLRRLANDVTGRDVLTLDLDNIPAGNTDAVLDKIRALGCSWCVYSTRKHRPEAPRLRVLIPLDRTVTPEEYEPIARRITFVLGMELADPTTFEVNRLMFWPSCCSDSEFIYQHEDKPLLSADRELAMYTDWRNVASWPVHPSETKIRTRTEKRMGEPTEKPGLIGAFCNVYGIVDAMETFLPGVYLETLYPDRFTYAGGSTAGGAVVYDNKFLYSHHATDPCSGREVNSFDMVRIHRFGDLDEGEDVKPDTPPNRLPSYTAMLELASKDPKVVGWQLHESAKAAEIEPSEEAEDSDEWITRLARNKNGSIDSTINNVLIILENDPNLKDRFALNEFAARGEVLQELPWLKSTGRRPWSDTDSNGLYWYLESVYKITKRGNIDAALDLHSSRHAFNDVTAYLNSLQWDGRPRLETLFVDYLGAVDTPYTRAVTRKALVGAVARALTPRCKFDTMTILSGPQGIGKSTMLDTLSRGWFNDSIRTFEGKEASELLQGVWIVEISELEAFRRSDVSRIKQFLSQRVDRFRAAYGRHVKEFPRRCVFFGTTNSSEYLQDRTGNRRFWPVDVGILPTRKNVFTDLRGEVDQIWAEAVVYWRVGEPLYLSGDMAAAAREQQESHREASTREGIIQDWLDRPVPVDWASWDLPRRQAFWNGSVLGGDLKLVPRDRVCVLEVWCEALGGNRADCKPNDSKEIAAVISALPRWEKCQSAIRFGPYGKQRGWAATDTKNVATEAD